MRHILTSVFLVVLLFPALALGGEVKLEDLVITHGLYFKKFTNIPFTGKVTGKVQGSFKDGKRVGVWIVYNLNGRVSKEVTYENGKKVTWVQYKYHSNGQLRTKETYKDGKFDGPWVDYHENGQLLTKGTYKEGYKEGPWVNFNEDGTVDEERTGTFKNGVKISD